MALIGVINEGATVPNDDQSWLVNRKYDGVQEVTLDLGTFTKDEYFTGAAEGANTVFVKSGIPLARITGTGEYGPYDAAATDGRAEFIAGLLESALEATYGRNGLTGVKQTAGMRYSAVINVDKLPVAVAADAVWRGDFHNGPKGEVVVSLSTPAAVDATPVTP